MSREKNFRIQMNIPDNFKFPISPRMNDRILHQTERGCWNLYLKIIGKITDFLKQLSRTATVDQRIDMYKFVEEEKS